jgi:uncharacterized protein (TIGR03000 family)
MNQWLAYYLCFLGAVLCQGFSIAEDAVNKAKAKARAAWAWSSAPAKSLPGCSCPPGCECGCALTGQCACGHATAAGKELPKTDAQQPVTLIFEVPATATVWLEGQEMTITGTSRTFVSPPMEPGREYTYSVRVQDAYGTEETRRLAVKAGGTYRESFRQASVPSSQDSRGDRLPAMPYFLNTRGSCSGGS